jgi:type II secretory pathway component PulF
MRSGLMTAQTEKDVAASLKSMGCAPVAVRRSGLYDRLLSYFGSSRIRASDVRLYTEQLAALQKAGIPITVSLKTIHDSVAERNFQDMIASVLRDIEEGKSLSAALNGYPEVFKPLYVSVVRSSEAAGTLGEGLERLAALASYEERIGLRIKTATRYPLTVLGAALLGFIILIVAVVPRFASLYAQSAADLPLPTRALLFIHGALTSAWWLLAAGIASGVYAARIFVRSTQGRFFWDTVKLRVPVWGQLELKLAMSRFSRVFAALIRSGVDLFSVLDLTAEGVGNSAVSKVIAGLKASVSEGKGLSAPLRSSGVFPPIVTQMIATGEQTGKLDDVLSRLSQYYDTQVEYMVDNLTSMIEPVLILILGCLVLGMALGIFLPIWNLSHLFGLGA